MGCSEFFGLGESGEQAPICALQIALCAMQAQAERLAALSCLNNNNSIGTDLFTFFFVIFLENNLIFGSDLGGFLVDVFL